MFAMFSIGVHVSLLTKTWHRVQAGNDVIDILTSEGMENTPLQSRM